MDEGRTPHDQPGPLYWRAGALARALGVQKRLLIADAVAGRLPVPVRLARFGASGICHVNADDARRLVSVLTTPKAQK